MNGRGLVAAALLLAMFAIADAGVVELEVMMSEMERKVMAVATAAETWQARRCDVNVVGRVACGNTNYHTCGSKLPQPVCEDGSQVRLLELQLCEEIIENEISCAH